MERTALRVSQAGALLLAASGVTFALLAKSDAIMVDALYNLVLFTMALLSARVARLVGRPDDERFPFGYANFEPLLNLTKGLTVGFIQVWALYAAVTALLSGGRHTEPGLGVLYAVIGSGLCFGLALYQRDCARRTGSPLLAVDAKNWAVDGALCVAVAVAFAAVMVLERTAWKGLVPYADPVIVIILIALLAHVPLGIIRSNLAELLLAAPAAEFRAAVLGRVTPLVTRPDVAEVTPRLVKTGRRAYLNVYLTLRAGSELASVGAQDALRREVLEALAAEFPGLFADLIFTSDRAYAVSPGAWEKAWGAARAPLPSGH
jgi:cation diffusion facilitator family transporter